MGKSKIAISFEECLNAYTIMSDEKCTECGEWFGDHKEGCKNEMS